MNPSPSSPHVPTPPQAKGAVHVRLPSSHGLARAIGVLVFCGILVVVEFTLHLLQQEAETRAHADATRFASMLRAGIERELNAVLYLSSGLTSYLTVRRNSLDQEEVQAILSHLFQGARHVRNFAIAVGYRLTYVYPVNGNEEAVGLYYPDIPSQWPQVQRAIESDLGTLVGPLPLVQGGEGLVFRVPVRINDVYWGLLATVIDSPSLLAAAVRDLDTVNYRFAIRGRDGEGARGEVFIGDPGLFEQPEVVTLETMIPNGSWVLAVLPRAAVKRGDYSMALRLMGWGMALMLGLSTATVLRHRIDLAQLALYDPLTTLPNRRHLEDSLTQVLERTPRGDGRHSGLLFIDLDGFKAINDNHGHKAGDVLLKTLGERICALVRTGDTVARWGGDELVVVVEDSSAADLASLIERLRHAIEQPVEYDGKLLSVGVSIGCAVPPQDGRSPLELLKVADQRMYEEKKQRRRSKED